MKEIRLSNGATALVDDEDFEYLNQFKWHLCSKHYAGRHIYTDSGTRTFLKMHNELMPDSEKGKSSVDHIDRNKLNNQRENLRYCTISQNSFNISPRSATGLRGVRYRPKKNAEKPYEAAIYIDGKHKHLGCFATMSLASLAYDAAARLAPDAEFRILNNYIEPPA